jgi:ABC-type transport system involved in multi-copper enzyme maturation permease subunit
VLARVLILARWTLVEALRERILYVVLLFVGVLVASSCILTPLAPGAQRKVVVDFGLACIDILGVLVILLSGCGLVRREIERRSLEVILTRPVSRLEYLIGKWLGLVATLVVLVAVMTAAFAILLQVSGVAWRAGFAVAIVGTVLGLLVVASLAVLFSTFTSPTLAAFFTLSLFAGGHLQGTILRLANDPTLTQVAEMVRWLVPALSVFDVRAEVVHGVHVPHLQLVGGAAYAVLYATAALYLASLLFRRRDLK